MNLLTVKDLVVGYQATDEIVKGACLRVAANEIVTIIGPNGAGKSTLLKAIAGQLLARSGGLEFDGKDITRTDARRRASAGLAYVAQEMNTFPSLSVRENLLMGGHVLLGKDRNRRLEEVLAQMPTLAGRMRERAGNLSGGQRQLLAVMAALMSRPKLILLDEPSAGLSPKATEELFQTLIDIRALGVSFLMIEQNAFDALAFSDRAYVIVLGRNFRDGPGAAIAADPDIRQAFLGL